MNINDYYTKELEALRTLGEEFSQRNPGLASFLSEKGQDPDVERLLEGFAFLIGRLRQSMDKEFPEFTHALTGLLWSNYLQPIPSYTIIEFTPEINMMQRELIKKDTKLFGYSDEHRVDCSFKTSYDVELLPLKVEKVEYFSSGFSSTIEIDIAMTSQGSLLDLDMDKLRFYLGGSNHISEELYLYLNRFIENITLIVGEADERVECTLGNDTISAVGFGKNENILPKKETIFQGYMLIQEFFCYRDKFSFIDISGFDKLKRVSKENSNSFRIKIELKRELELSKKLNTNNFRLFCTPAINIFKTDAIPFNKSNQEEEYQLILSQDGQSEIYSILKVEGWAMKQNKYQEFLPFGLFKHTEQKERYYSERIKLSEDNKRINTFIRFSPELDQKSYLNRNMTISTEVLATNKNVPSKLNLGSINRFDSSSTISNVSVKNITTPSKSFLPPIQGDFLWRIISNMSLNYLSLNNIKTFRTLLESYDFIGFSDSLQQKHTNSMLLGLSNISFRPSEMLHQGFPLRGIEVTLEMNPDRYASFGEAYLFASMINEFLILYDSINSFHRFKVKIDRKGIFIWKPKIGQN
ncbi:Protein ImpG/VasA [hydrothermal vent metagenome]|uniref:Protein ImpG/VasA n=1 Tax=hydrothermal vent metagenome TaxID=652676 RepID=A0A1W1BD20_9ZZZZ